MREADLIALQQIRKAAGNVISEPVWQVIEAEVLEKGISGLSGTARLVVNGVVAKHGGNSHNQDSHGHGGGGGSSSSAAASDSDTGPINRAPAGGASGKFGSPDYVKVGSISGQVSQRGKPVRENMSAEDRELVLTTSRKQVEDAKGQGMQPPEGGRFLGLGDGSHRLSSHGQVMHQAEINGGSTPRVKTDNGGSATVKGFKNKADIADGDVIGLTGNRPGKTGAYVVVGRAQVPGQRGGTFEKLEVRSIGKNGKPTGAVQQIGLQEIDEAVSILSPRQSR